MTKNEKYFYLEGWLSIVFNIFLFALKYWAGIVTGSLAIIADAWHTLSDSFSSIILVVGIKYSHKPADDEHPFGHGRIELILSIIIGVLLLFVSFEFLSEAIKKISDKEYVIYGNFAIIVTIISIISKEILAQIAFWLAKKANSTVLKADAWHHRSDAVSSIVILIGIFLGKYFWWIDILLGVIVALLIAYAAWGILKDAFNPLIGENPDPDLKEKIKNICSEVGETNVRPHHFHIHKYGNHTELTFHLKFPDNLMLLEAHNEVSLIEEKIKNELNIEATIHMEPIKNDKTN